MLRGVCGRGFPRLTAVGQVLFGYKLFEGVGHQWCAARAFVDGTKDLGKREARFNWRHGRYTAQDLRTTAPVLGPLGHPDAHAAMSPRSNTSILISSSTHSLFPFLRRRH